jgi:hypothetical protein
LGRSRLTDTILHFFPTIEFGLHSIGCANNFSLIFFNHPKKPDMKKILMIASLLLGTVTFAGTPTEVNEKVLTAFRQTFTTAKDVVWYEYGDSYTVNFKQAEIKTRVIYDKNGNILESYRYYQEEQLPPPVVSKIRKKFPGKKIFGVTERSTEYDVSFHIMLEGEKDWLKVKSDVNGYMELEQKFLKQE